MDSKHTVKHGSENDDGFTTDLVHVLGLTLLIVAIAALVASGAAFGGTLATGVSGNLAVVGYKR